MNRKQLVEHLDSKKGKLQHTLVLLKASDRKNTYISNVEREIIQLTEEIKNANSGPDQGCISLCRKYSLGEFINE